MLSRLRSPQNLALDLYDQPQYIKPALVEISISTEGTYSIELRASLEALLTGGSDE